MAVVNKIKCAFLVLLAVNSVHATTIPDTSDTSDGFPGLPGFPGHGPAPPVHSPPPPPPPPPPPRQTSTTQSSKTTKSAKTTKSSKTTKPSKTTSVSSSHFSTPPASLSVPASVTAGVAFSTDFLKAFYPGFGPTQTSVEPQPIITDPVTHEIFPLDLTNPKTIPTQNVVDPVVLPPSVLFPNVPNVISPQTDLSTPASIEFGNVIISEIKDILTNVTGGFTSSCGQCTSSLALLKTLALAVPWEVPRALIDLCMFTRGSSLATCTGSFAANSDGDIITQIIANAGVTGEDGELMCNKGLVPLGKSCPAPGPTDLTELLKTWFKKPKPANAVAPKPSGKKPIRVAHLSDFHIDPRYTIGAEANCDQSLCCRPTSNTSSVPAGQFSLQAPRFGAYECDTPWMLANAVMHAIPQLTGIDTGLGPDGKPAAFAIFTGDLTSHDSDRALGRDYVSYVEAVVYELFKEYFVHAPVYATMGNHDTWPQAIDAPHSLKPASLANQFSWNYDHLANLWQHEGWIPEDVADVAKAMYSAYSIVTPFGLKVISLNTDFWYMGNNMNIINSSNPDNSGMLRFLTDELQEAEDAGQRVWIIGHVLPGWSQGNAYQNPTNLLYQIIDRFTPHVIASVFMGHIHDEVRIIYYQNNGTVMDASTAATVTWCGGSVSPLAGLNSAFSMYEVDPVTFDIMDAFVWYANVSSFTELDQEGKGVEYKFEYSTRDAYGVGLDWPTTSPLNATWWHMVSESMEENPSLLDQFVNNQGRQSALTQNCTSTECTTAKVCYMRSGSPPLSARCPQGFGSVQE